MRLDPYWLMVVVEKKRPVMLCILDGWGDGAPGPNNAITLTETPNFDAMVAAGPRTQLLTSAGHVGLPEGQMGNSEVGHQNLGAGRVVLQDLPRIDQAVADGSLMNLENLQEFISDLRLSGGTCHLMGLLSPGGVHCHQNHMVALAKAISTAGIPVAIHSFLDGRDTPPRSANGFAGQFLSDLGGLQNVTMATVCGRYFAMDRDRRWERVVQAYDAMASGRGASATDLESAIADSYGADVGDEFLIPAIIAGYGGMADGDGLLMSNFRADRAREILTALVDPDFDGFERSRQINFSARLGMISYSSDLDNFIPSLFAAEELKNTLGAVVSQAGMTQLRIAETEKYAHVTFFLNGGDERVFDGEERILIPSPKVATYDLQPEMSAGEVTNKLVAAIGSGRFDLIVANYANPDMVGHTGDLSAAKKAVAWIDKCLGRLSDTITAANGVMLITADHGNIEQMWDAENDDYHTAHTTNPVPLVLVNGPEGAKLQNGRLADVAPTLLQLLQLPMPAEMTGASLLQLSEADDMPSNGHKDYRQPTHA